MSRWLNQVNHLLERLDGQVETAAAVVAVDAAPAAAALQTVSARAAAGLSFVQKRAAAVADVVAPPRTSRNEEEDETSDDDDDYIEDYIEDDYGNVLDGDDDQQDGYYEQDEMEDVDGSLKEETEDPGNNHHATGESNDGDDEYDQDEIRSIEEEDDDDDYNGPATTDTASSSALPARETNVPSGKAEETQYHAESMEMTNELKNWDILNTNSGEQQHGLPIQSWTNEPGISATGALRKEESSAEPDPMASTTSTTVSLQSSLPSSLPASASLPVSSSGNTRKSTPLPYHPPSSGSMQYLQHQMQLLKRGHAEDIAKLVQQNETSMQLALAQAAADAASLRRQNEQYQTEAAAIRHELVAVNKELQQAAVTVEQERALAREERDELLYEQHDELEQQKATYESQIQRLRSDMQELQSQFELQRSSRAKERMQLDSNVTAELEALALREKLAQQAILTHQESFSRLQGQFDQLNQQHSTMVAQWESASARLMEAEAKASNAELRLDATMEQHKKQLQQRLAREATLEETVAQLSHAAATMDEHANVTLSASDAAAASDEREKMARELSACLERIQLAAEELELKQTELTVSQKRCQLLESELIEMSRLRELESAASQTAHQEQVARLAALSQAHQRSLALNDRESNQEASTSKNSTAETERFQTNQEVKQLQQHVESLSDQLRRQQGLAETFKSEALALKGRLQVATARAESAERMRESPLEIESGTNQTAVQEKYYKRRVKGGATAARFGPMSTRTIRTAIGWNRTRSPSGRRGSLKQQIGDSIDALDTWMLETGNILRHEPLARLGLALYLMIIHVWCFGLIMFHTIEAEHGDLGYITNRGKVNPLVAKMP